MFGNQINLTKVLAPDVASKKCSRSSLCLK